VGLTEEQAEAQGIEVGIGEVPIAINLYAMILDKTAGVIKIIADRKYGEILGVHIMAPGAVGLINVASVAMLSEATVDELIRLIPMHPALERYVKVTIAICQEPGAQCRALVCIQSFPSQSGCCLGSCIPSQLPIT
jgi:pyruvate/2-oxoglutarate dehydrogenase complex dihydrolipoamide dehydrogenase (E3) component